MNRCQIAVAIAVLLMPTPVGAQDFRPSLGLGFFVPAADLGVSGATTGRRSPALVAVLGIDIGNPGRHFRIEMVQGLTHGTNIRPAANCRYRCRDGRADGGRFVAATISRARQIRIADQEILVELGAGVRDYRRVDFLTVPDDPPPNIPEEAVGHPGAFNRGGQASPTLRLGASYRHDAGKYLVVASLANHVSRSEWGRTQHDLVLSWSVSSYRRNGQ